MWLTGNYKFVGLTKAIQARMSVVAEKNHDSVADNVCFSGLIIHQKAYSSTLLSR